MESIERHRFLQRAFLGCLFLSTVIVSAYLVQANPGAVFAAMTRFNPFFLLLGLATVFASWIVEGLRVHLIALALEERVPVWPLIRINIATSFSGNVVPFASMTAPPTQVFLLHREGIPLGKATAIVAIRTAASTLFFTTCAPLLLFSFGTRVVRQLIPNLALSALLQVILFASAVAALLTLAILIRPELGARLTNAAFSLRFVRRLLGTRSEQVVERVAREAREFHASMTGLFRSPGYAAVIALLTVVYWVLYFSVAPLLLLGVGFGLQFTGALKMIALLFLTYFLLSYLPIPTGSGVSELSFGSILLFFGIPDPIRTVILVVWSFLCVQIYTLLGGAFFLGALRRRTRPKEGLPG
ncbi:MAG: flippase-like domain-containing protein [Firmicutes bacterium]|nr:flippase-like domain-containing protein [Bacillota bacterium]